MGDVDLTGLELALPEMQSGVFILSPSAIHEIAIVTFNPLSFIIIHYHLTNIIIHHYPLSSSIHYHRLFINFHYHRHLPHLHIYWRRSNTILIITITITMNCRQGPTRSQYPTRPELFFKYPTRPDPKIENDWVPGN